jgi:hypothetical protein
MSGLEDYLIGPKVSLPAKTRIQIGKDAADGLVKRALRDWSKGLFAEFFHALANNRALCGR